MRPARSLFGLLAPLACALALGGCITVVWPGDADPRAAPAAPADPGAPSAVTASQPEPLASPPPPGADAEPLPPSAPAAAPIDTLTLALFYLNGIRVERDFARGHELLRQAAAEGEAEAEAAFLLGRLHEEGVGVAADFEAAMEWFESAARLGHRDSQYRVGVGYYRGEGRPFNTVTGVRWLRAAAAQGHAGAQYQLGVAYHLGRGIHRDEVRAVRWLEAAAEQDHVLAQYLTGDAYADGWGSRPDPSWAARWYGRAAWQGLDRAQYKLALFYLGGSGVPRDPVRAYKWARLASGAGQADAGRLVHELQAALSPEQLSLAQAQAAAFRPAGPLGDGEVDRAAVAFAQFALGRLGYDPGPVDGNLGAQTRDAVAAYRAAIGAEPGAALTPELLRRLKADRLALETGG